MSIANNVLAYADVAIIREVDIAAVRALLRAERKKRRMSLDALAKASGVTRTTIHDVEKNPKSHPRLETITRLIEGMEGMTVAGFFAALERQSSSDKPDDAVHSQSNLRTGTQFVKTPPGETTTDGRQSLSVRSHHTADDAAFEALVDISNRIIDALELVGRRRAPAETHTPGGTGSGGPRRSHGNR